MRNRVFNFLLAFALIALMAVPAIAARSTRDLVFEDDEESAAVAQANIPDAEAVAIRTTLELTRDGQKSTVLPTHRFKSGDRVKLRYTMNNDGYVYWLAKMSSGKYAVLFPTNATGMDNYVKKNVEQTVPVKGSFRFDDTAGTESLLIVYCVDRIPELDEAVAEANGQKGNTIESKGGSVANIESSNTSKRRSRDLVFEDEDDEDINTKTQVAPRGEPMVALFELVHE